MARKAATAYDDELAAYAGVNGWAPEDGFEDVEACSRGCGARRITS